MAVAAVAQQSRRSNSDAVRPGKHFYEFGGFCLDTGERLLLRGENPLRMPPKVFDTLRILVENSGHVLEKEELLRQVWPDTFVEENNLNKSISALRKILGRSINGRSYIETVPKLGYRFVAEVTERREQPPVSLGSIQKVTAHFPAKTEERPDTGEAPEGMGAKALVKVQAPGFRQAEATLGRQSMVLGLALLGLLLGLAYQVVLRRRAPEGRMSSQAVTPTTAVKNRRSVAVLGFKNLTGRPEEQWLATALSEMLSTELAGGEEVREIPEEDVARMKLELGLRDDDALSKDTLVRVRRILGADLVVLGSYTALGTDRGGQIRLDLRLQDAEQGESIAAVAETGTEADLFELVSRSGARLRDKLGLREVTTAEASSVRASLPSNPEAVRLYAEGLGKMRIFDALAARGLLEKAVAADPSNPLAHSALADAWSKLGYDSRAGREAKKAFDLSANLSREQRSLVEGRYWESIHEWGKAIEIYRALFESFPDNLEYGLRLGAAQNSADKSKGALATVEALRKLPPPERDDPRIDLMEARAAEQLSDFKQAQKLCETAASKGTAWGERLLVAVARYSETRALVSLGQPQEAIATIGEARRIFDAAGDRKGEAQALNGIGIVLRHQGDLAAAKRNYEASLAIVRQIGDRGDEVVELDNIALVLTDQGDLSGARGIYVQSLSASRQLGDKGGVALELNNLGEVLTDLGQLEEGRKVYEESLGICREIGDRDGVAYAQVNLAKVQEYQGDLGHAARMYEEAWSLFVQLGDKYGSAQALGGLGEVAAEQGNLLLSRHKHEAALALWNQQGEQERASASRLRLAELSIEEGRPSAAEALARLAAEEFRKEKVPDNEAEAIAVLSRSLAAQRKLAEAIKEMERARVLSANSQNVELHLSVSATAGRVHALAGQRADAIKLLEAAFSDATKAGFVRYQLETRLALGEVGLKSSQRAADRAPLAALQADATARGFLLIAREAAEARRSE